MKLVYAAFASFAIAVCTLTKKSSASPTRGVNLFSAAAPAPSARVLRPPGVS